MEDPGTSLEHIGLHRLEHVEISLSQQHTMSLCVTVFMKICMSASILLGDSHSADLMLCLVKSS